jgi:hypothetical protein
VKGRIRWAIVTALLSVVLAVALGVAALSYSDEEHAAATPAGPIEGSYVFVSTTIEFATPFANNTVLVFTGGRLAIGGDGHTFWSLQMHSTFDTSKTGRLSCEGGFDSTTRRVTPSPRYGYGDFGADLANAMMQTLVYDQFCAGNDQTRPENKPWVVSQGGPMLQMTSPAGVLVWRRE